jgi:hypothetical protein
MQYPIPDPKEAPILAAAAMPFSPQSSRRRSATLKPVRYRDDDDDEREKEEKKLIKDDQKKGPRSSSNSGARKRPPTLSQASCNNNSGEDGGGSSDEEKPTKKRPRSSNPWEKLNQVPNVATTTPVPSPSKKKSRSPQEAKQLHKKSIPSSSSSISPQKKQIEMQYLHKGRKVKVRLFDSFPKASDKTGISVPLIKIVCEEGGGFINSAWFEYSQPNHNTKTTAKTSVTTLGTTTGTSIVKTKKKNILPKSNDFFRGGGTPFDVTSLRLLLGLL